MSEDHISASVHGRGYPGMALNIVAGPLEFPDEPWMGEAICSQVDPEVFYPEKGGTTAPAKLICAQCPVVDECLAYALEHGERFGIWGGLSDRERRRLGERPHKERTPAPCGTPAAYQRHYRDKEKPCDACRRADRANQAERRLKVGNR
jgi:WhiB family redox-sensing transcriptional regulator